VHHFGSAGSNASPFKAKLQMSMLISNMTRKI